MIDFEKQLNKEQLEVVKTVQGPLLVVAGAGSGKTRVIEYRVLYFVQNKIAPQSILLLTFTRRAAAEMLSRAARHDPRCNYVEGGTFHSFAYQTLKRYSTLIGFSKFVILDESDAQEAIQVCLGRTNLHERDKRFPRKDTLRKIFSMAVNKDISIEEVLEKEYPDFIEYSLDLEKIRAEYIGYKKNKSYLDYDDLLVYLKTLLTTRDDIRDRLADRFRYIMVDEYQDTNKLQADITYLLGKKHNNVMAVGDDAQSIYGFRGANHKNIMDFPRRFPGCRIIKLQTNYRSIQEILDVANEVLKNMKNKYAKYLYSANKQQGDRPKLLFFKDHNSEAQWIAEKIEELNEEGVDFSQQAVLFRSAYISIPLQLELNRRDIPYKVYGGMKFYETAHVKDILAHLKIALNIKDEISWSRVLMLIEGIGPKISHRIINEIEYAPNLSASVRKISLTRDKTRKYHKGLTNLLSILKEISDKKTDVRRQFEIVLSYYYPILKYKYDDWKQRINDLEALTDISGRYSSLADFLADFALDPPARGAFRIESSFVKDELPLTLSTIHSAKGLEWESVFLIGLVEGILPVSFSLDDEEGIEEELRLFYVGLTRAKKRLFLSLHHQANGSGMTQFNKISRFIDSLGVLSKLDRRAVIDDIF